MRDEEIIEALRARQSWVLDKAFSPGAPKSVPAVFVRGHFQIMLEDARKHDDFARNIWHPLEEPDHPGGRTRHPGGSAQGWDRTSAGGFSVLCSTD